MQTLSFLKTECDEAQTLTSSDNGSFVFKLDYNQKYTLSFSKAGLISKSIEFDTKIPDDQADVIIDFYGGKFKVDLFSDTEGKYQNQLAGKPVAKKICLQ